MIELELVVLLKMGNFIFSCLESVSLSMHAWPLMSGTTHLCHHESCREDINFFVSHLTSPTLVTSEGQHIEVEYLHFFLKFSLALYQQVRECDYINNSQQSSYVRTKKGSFLLLSSI